MKSQKPTSPPRWADRLLEFYCNPRLLEQIQGDVHELYYWRLSEKGEKQAKWAFWWDIIRFFRWRNIKRSTTQQQQFNSTGMLKNYFKIGWRNLLKQKQPSLINILGLAIAIACCIVAYLFIEGNWLKGMYHENKDHIYMITHTATENDEVTQFGYLSSPLANVIKENFPSVKYVSRINNARVVVNCKNENFSQFVQYVDSQYMDMFTYNVLYGSAQALDDPNQVIVTESVAQKFFRDEFPVGEEIRVYINGEAKAVTIGAVMEDLSNVAMFNFDILLNNQLLNSTTSLDENWEKSSWTFLQIEEEGSSVELLAGLKRLVDIHNEMDQDNKYLGIQLEPMMGLSRMAEQIEGGAANGANLAPQIVLAAIGIFMLTLAIFNYINIAILMATKRVKEIGVRKAIGVKRSQLVFQFLTENLITCLISITLGVLIAITLFIPWFNDMATTNLKVDLLNDPYIYLFFGGLLVFITLASGAYPAFYISSFKPVDIFSGKQRMSSKSVFTSVLLTFQFVLAIITIISGIAFVQTNNINHNRDWGYDNSSKIVVNLPSDKEYKEIKNELLQQSQVLGTAGSMDLVGRNISETTVKIGEEEMEVDFIRATANYPDIMGFRLSEGRLFNSAMATDITNSIIVNRTFMDWYNLEFPVEQTVTIDSNEMNIIGIVEDFHAENFAFSINPVVISALPDSNMHYLTIKVAEDQTEVMATFVKELWHEKVDNDIYNGIVQAEMFDMYFFEMKGLRNTMLFTATLAVILSAMGLFGLVSLNINNKMKDFGIRKILGATMFQLSKIIVKRIVILWAIGCLIGGLLGSMAIGALLDSVYSFHSGVGALPLFFAISFLLIVILLTVSMQLVKVKNSNPVDTLRIE
ncbi:ABC transporter permease [Fulvivirga lutimaris]|uniref:ABC transporter permease n=1 Tax=Fulvivirga lutimaris TaxID=1819566 RepID=UPI0012BC088A|nr:ABC transporter permease [Fulvivirga lutimaris]MTI41962.1 ABC transporter permease [Fulvivirga lutimaris]